MSNKQRRLGPASTPGIENHPTNDNSHQDSNKNAATEERDFSWYGGQVDEAVVREIVRLKREHKL